MPTHYPFKIPPEAGEVPAVAGVGLVGVDVLLGGRWEGVLLINNSRECVGIRLGGELIQEPLCFSPSDIKMVRKTCLWNRFLSRIPTIVLWSYPYTCLLLLPLLYWSMVYTGTWGGIALLLAGAGCQRLLIEHRKAFCLAGAPLFLYALLWQVVVIGGILSKLWGVGGGIFVS